MTVQVHMPAILAHCSQDIFQWMMDQIIKSCKDIIEITDDIIVHGKDSEEHDR